MKRFVVIVASLLIILVFIALNYLIWDRESLVTLRESNQDSIDTLNRMNMSLNQEKSRLEQQTEELRNQIEVLEENITNLEKDIQQQKNITNERNRFILNMKSHIDTLPVQTITIDWVNRLNEKGYAEAYLKSSAECNFWGNRWSMRMFEEYFNENVEQIQLLREESNPNIDVIPIQTPDWEMSVYVHVLVDLKEGAPHNYLNQGENIVHLTYTYSERLDQWMITSVFSEEIAKEEPITEANH